MRRALTLHIGVTKTGSTSIQYALWRARKELAAQGIWYPVSAGPDSLGESPHHYVAASVTDPKRLGGFHQFMWDGMSPAVRLRLFREQFAAEMRELPMSISRCILTSELLSRLEDREVEALGDLLNPFFESVKVIVYIRRQDQHLASNFNQRLRNKMPAEPQLPRRRPLDRLNELTLDYDSLTARFSRVFGNGSVVPRIFDRAELAGGDVVRDFLEMAKIKLAVPKDSKSKQMNPSINLQGQALLMAVINGFRDSNGDMASDPAAWRRLAEIVTRDFPGPGWKPARAEAEQCLAMFSDCNERVRQRYFPERAALFDDDLSALPSQPELPSEDKALDAAVSTVRRLSADWVRREMMSSMEKYRLLKKFDDREGMRGALRAAIKLVPDAFAPRLRMAELCLNENRLTEAAEHAKVAARIKRESLVAKRLVATVRAKLREAGAAAS